jgi:hypothetical protein
MQVSVNVSPAQDGSQSSGARCPCRGKSKRGRAKQVIEKFASPSTRAGARSVDRSAGGIIRVQDGARSGAAGRATTLVGRNDPLNA